MGHINQVVTKIMWAAEYYTCNLFHKLTWTELPPTKFKTKVLPTRRAKVNTYLSGINLMNMVLDLRKTGKKNSAITKARQISTHLLILLFMASAHPNVGVNSKYTESFRKID